MLTALVLICSLSATPDIRDCSQYTAQDVIRLSIETGHPGHCAMMGEAFVAGTELGRSLNPDDALKVVCAPSARVTARARLWDVSSGR